MNPLVISRIQTPDGTILTSKFTHDYQKHIDKNGEEYFLDGGRDYQRYSENKEPFKDLSLYLDSDFEQIRKEYKRGTFDKDGKRIWKPMCEMSNEHLRNCIIYNIDHGFPVDNLANILYMKELEYRLLNDIEIKDDWDDEVS